METNVAPVVKKKRGRSLLWGVAAVVLGGLFVVDAFIPDPLPFIDEVVAGVLTLVSGFKALQSLFARE